MLKGFSTALAALTAAAICVPSLGLTHTAKATRPTNQLTTADAPIILDAGHGGADRGASHNGIHESHIALHITKLVGAELTQLGHHVEYTRQGDEWLPLERRAQIANSLRGRLFVSIHLNSSTDPRAHGKEIYFQNQVPVDEESMFLANRENLTENLTDNQGSRVTSNGVTDQIHPDLSSRTRASQLREAEEALVPPLQAMSPDIKNDVQNIVEDLNRSARVRSSSKLAIRLLKQVALTSTKTESTAASTARRSIRQAPFFLLSHVAMPSVLVEVGYLSHPAEAARLKQEAYQQSLAKTIATGIHKSLTEIK